VRPHQRAYQALARPQNGGGAAAAGPQPQARQLLGGFHLWVFVILFAVDGGFFFSSLIAARASVMYLFCLSARLFAVVAMNWCDVPFLIVAIYNLLEFELF
jgi:hypothetical protein